MKNKSMIIAGVLLLLFLGGTAWLHTSVEKERRAFGRFLIDNKCSRYYTYDTFNPLYRCAGGYWTQSDIGKMI